jgi:Ferric reductase NAD binding domain/FAD-binding domain
LSSHPFTICSLPSMSPSKPSEMTFYIRHQGGFTARLWSYAMKYPGAQVPVFVDGPYGGIDNMKYFGSDRLVVAAGGSGAGWMLPFAEQFLRYHSLVTPESSVTEINEDKQTSGALSRQRSLRGPRTLRLILATRDAATRTWFHTTVNNLLSEYKALGTPSDMTVEVHLTGEAEKIVEPPTKFSPELKRSGSETTGKDPIGNGEGEDSKTGAGAVPQAEVRGRPDLPLIIREEVASAKETGESVSVFVCGPLQMQDDARNAVARENLSILKNPSAGGVYLHLEHFSWA